MAFVALLILVVPVLELFVIANVASNIGFFETVGLLILISVIGAWLLKREGLAAWRRLRAAIERGEMPTREVIDGALIVFGGALLITPGFLTDAVGLFFMFPVTRTLTRSWARKITNLLIVKRFGATGAAASAGKRVYDARVTRVRRVEGGVSPRTGSAPSELPDPSDEDGSPDRG